MRQQHSSTPSERAIAPLAGRVAVVTGGAAGLGAATVIALRQAGARVVRLDRDALATGAAPPMDGVESLTVDVCDGPGIERAFDAIAARLGTVSILVNCAGIADPAPVLSRGQAMPLENFRRVIDVNLLGVINCIRCAVPQMIDGRTDAMAEAGVIVNAASIAAYDGQVGQAAYAASKGGVVGLVLPLARELGEHGIRVMGIAPGVFETPMTLNLPPKSRQAVFAATPPYPPRAGRAHEFADLVLSIIANPMLNGEVVRLDGGLRMPARL